MPTPEELRSRAASIFQQLRGGAPRSDAEHSGEQGSGATDPEPAQAEPAQAEPPQPAPGDASDEAGERLTGELAAVAEGAEPPLPAAADAELADRLAAEREPAHENEEESIESYEPAMGASDVAVGDAAAAAASIATANVAAEPAPDAGTDATPADAAPADAVAPAARAEQDYPPYRPRRSLPRVLAIANQKGGVGKTTTAVNLGAALAELGYRVLVIDLDPQGNATTGLGVNARNLDVSIYDVVLRDVPIEDCIEPTSLRNLFVVPATIDLAGAEVELVSMFSRELRLRKAVEGLDGEFDFTLIDCPPSLGLLTVNGLAAATEVVVPIQCEYYALEGLGQLLRNVNLVQTNLNPALEVSTIVLTMYDARTRLAEQVVNEVRSHFGDKVCRNVVPRTVRLSEAPSFGQPIIVFDSSSRGAIAYRELAKEVSGGAPQRIG